MMKKNRLVSACLVLCLLTISGCGSVETMEENVIELIEPVGEELNWMTETVMLRNIYKADIYEASVYPMVEEYSFESRQTFEAYKAMLGDEVKKGDVILKGDTESLETQIENMEERLSALTEDYQEYLADINEEIASKEWYVGYYEEIFENLEEQKPEQYVTNAAGNQVSNPAYADWEKEWNKWLGTSNKNELDLWVAQEELRQKKEVYELDYAYYKEQLQTLKEKKEAATIRSEINGEVVSIGAYFQGQSMAAGNPVVAVGNMDKLCLKCELINRRTILYYAKEIYAYVNGSRYELIYDDNGDKECTTFYFAEEEIDAEAGDYAVIVLESSSKEQVISVNSSSIYVDSTGRYVYVLKDGENEKRYVKTGVTDGMYTEVLSGLEVGEQVLVTEKVEAVNTHVLEEGTFAQFLSKSGGVYYPIQFYVENPVEYGTVYFQEYLVKEYQYVEAGQPIARVRVEGDMVEMARMENELMRAKERLDDVLAEVTEENAESYEDRIERERESIAEQEEKLSKLKSDYAVEEIYAEESGIVMALNDYAKEQVIGANAAFLLMADAAYGYFVLENVTTVRYGDVFTISYNDASRKAQTAEVSAVTLGNPGVSASMDDKNVYFRMPEDVLNTLLEALRASTSRYSNRIRSTGMIKAMDNVVLVPVDAVTVVDEATYVNVLQENGEIIPVSFLAGGVDEENYWVIEGLTEGMTICWE